MHSDIKNTKQILRKNFLQIRRKMLPDHNISQAIITNCHHILTKLVANKIGIYAAISGEIDILSLAKGQGVYALPCIKDENLIYCRYSFGDKLVRAEYGTQITAVIEEVEPEIIFVPAILFSRSGYRIGYGKGYFDRFMARKSETIFIGICASEYLVSQLPYQQHDKKVNYIITEQEILQI